MINLKKEYEAGKYYVEKSRCYYVISRIIKQRNGHLRVGSPIVQIKKEQRLKTIQRKLNRESVFNYEIEFLGYVEFLSKDEIKNLLDVDIEREIAEQNPLSVL